MSAAEMLACFQGVNRAAIRTLGAACATHVQKYLGVVVPDWHARFGAGTEHTALVVQVGGEQLYSGYIFRSRLVCHDF
jgi:hypothetical protein